MKIKNSILCALLVCSMYGIVYAGPVVHRGGARIPTGQVLDIVDVRDGDFPYMQAAGGGLGSSPLSTDGTDVTNSGNYLLVDDNFIGFGAAKGRIEFDDQATDEVNILDANVGIGTDTPGNQLDVKKDAIGVTPVDINGIRLSNTTAAQAGAQQWSPPLTFQAQGWKTNATAESQKVEFMQDVRSVQGAAAPTGFWGIYPSIDDGAYSATPALAVDSAGKVGIGMSTPSEILEIDTGAANFTFLDYFIKYSTMLTIQTRNNGSLNFTTVGNGQITFDSNTVGSGVITLGMVGDSDIITINGEVGINTTTPAGKLHTVLAVGSPAIFGGDTIATLTGVAGTDAVPTVLTLDATIDDGLAVGDGVLITAGTNATAGLYRVVSIIANTSVTLDRNASSGGAISAAVVTYITDAVVATYTDGTNGPMLRGVSSTDKPLQIGGDVLAATGHSLGSEDVLIGGMLEVDGESHYDAVAIHYSTLRVNDDKRLNLGAANSDANFLWETNGAHDFLKLIMGVNSAAASGNFIIVGDFSTQDFDHAVSPNPTLFIHSALDPDTSNNQWGSFTHDQEDFVITTGVNVGTGSAPTTDENGIKLFPRGGAAGLHVKGDGEVETTGNIVIGGAQITNITTVNAASYDVLATDYILHVTYTDTGTVAIDLKTAQLQAGRIIHIKDSDFNAGTNNITITTEGGATIDEAATYIITANGNAVSLYCDGSNYFIY